MSKDRNNKKINPIELINIRNEVIDLITELPNLILNCNSNLSLERVREQVSYIRSLYEKLGNEKSEVYNIELLTKIEERLNKRLIKQSTVPSETGDNITYHRLGEIEYHFLDGYSLVVQSSAMLKDNINNFMQNIYVLSSDRKKHNHRSIRFVPEYIPEQDYLGFVEDFNNIKEYYEFHEMKQKKWKDRENSPVIEMNMTFKDFLKLDRRYQDDVVKEEIQTRGRK